MHSVCRECHFGRIQATLAPFMATVAGKVLLIPNAPAYSCDWCGATEHDAHYLQDLQLLLRKQAEVTNQSADHNQQVAQPSSIVMPAI